MSEKLDLDAYLAQLEKQKAITPDLEAYAASLEPPPPPGKLEALGRGALQGATLGFSDELTGAGQGAWDALTKGQAFLDAYRKHRDESRANNAAAEKAHENFYGAGEIGGGLASMAVPGLGAAKGAKLLAAMAQMGALGAAGGLGGSEADLTKGELGRAAFDTAVGGAAGAGAGALGYGLEKLAAGVGGKLINKGAAKAVAADARAEELAAAKRTADELTKRSAAGRSSAAAYKNVRNIMDTGTEAALGPEERVAFDRLRAQLGESGRAGLVGDEAAMNTAKGELADAYANRSALQAADKAEMLKPAIGKSAKEFAKSYGEQLLGTTLGGYLGHKVDDITGTRGIGSSLGMALGLLTGRTRAAKSFATKLARPGVQMELANGLMSLGRGLTGRGVSALESSALRSPGFISGLESKLMDVPLIAEMFSDDEKRKALADALGRPSGDFGLQ